MDMLVRKGFFPALFVTLCLLFCFVSVSSASTSTGVFGSSESEGAQEFELDRGAKVSLKEIRQVSRGFPYVGKKNLILVVATVISPEDQIIKASFEDCAAFDNLGNRFGLYIYQDEKPAIWIGNEWTTERMIIRDVPTNISFGFWQGNVDLAKAFARVDLNLLGTMVTFRNVPSTK